MKKLDPQPRALFVIESDPEISPRPAEAVRIAAGLGAWKDIATDLLLVGPAVKALSAYPEELVDGHIFREYLPALSSNGGVILVEASSNPKNHTQNEQIKTKCVEPKKLSAELARYRFLFHF